MFVPINNLRQEELLKIFSMLPYRDVISVGRTCRRFHDLSQDKVLLKNIAKSEMNKDCWKFFNDEVNGVYPTREQINIALSLGSVIEIYFTFCVSESTKKSSVR